MADHDKAEPEDKPNDQFSAKRSGTGSGAAPHEARSTLALALSQPARGDDILGMVTHDLRNPLCVIAINAHSIVESTKEDSTREAAQEVTRAAARMDRLLTDLLDVARIESDTFRIVKQRHDVGALLTEMLQSYRPLFAARRVTLHIQMPVSSVVASFDRDRIVQVLSNLLSNAMKFAPPGGSVFLHAEARGRETEFILRDDGPGIHPDALPHVFDRFCQFDSDARRGLGLGLYICKTIVEAHGGRIWVESDFGHGAAFRFTLPAT